LSRARILRIRTLFRIRRLNVEKVRTRNQKVPLSAGRTNDAKTAENQEESADRTRPSQAAGNNGFCVLTLHATGNVRLEYTDWMTRVRATAELSGDADNRLKIDHVRAT